MSKVVTIMTMATQPCPLDLLPQAGTADHERFTGCENGLALCGSCLSHRGALMVECFTSGRNHSPVCILKEDVPIEGVTPASLETAPARRARVASPWEKGHVPPGWQLSGDGLRDH